MSYRVRILKISREDIRDATQWYESKRIGLGREYIHALREQIEILKESPQGYVVWHKQVRKAKTKRFPYLIYYLIDELKKEIIIIGILHGKRNQEMIKERKTL